MKIKILIVDDLAIFRENLYLCLTNLGFEDIEMAYDGLDAFQMICSEEEKGEPFDIVFSDILMPNCTGVELAQKIRDRGFKLFLFIVSTESSQETILDCIEAGAKDYLLKPYDETILRQKIENLIGKLKD